jgi:cupin fold WbuC family metalloprotein
MKISDNSLQTGKQIFHSRSWNTKVDDELIDELLTQARRNSNNKARFCLHPNSNESMQVTYLAFIAPYEDKIHCHPFRPEVLVPIRGQAEARCFDDKGNILKKELMVGGSGHALSTECGQWHSLRVESSEFVMIEIGIGPFRSDSTVFLHEKGGKNWDQ